MKPIHFILPLIFLITSCAPAAPVTPTATTAPTPTPTIVPLEILSRFLTGIQFTSVTDFESEPMNIDYNSELVSLSNGEMQMKAVDYKGGLNLRSRFNEGEGVIFDMRIVPGTPAKSFEFETYLDLGTWSTDTYRRFGMNLTSSPEAVLWMGKVDTIKYLSGNLTIEPDVKYRVALAVGQKADFLGLIWNPEKPEVNSYFHKSMGDEWSNNEWLFVINGGKGNMAVDNVMTFNFDGFSAVEPTSTSTPESTATIESTATPESTATSEPTATPEPTKITMPDGWTAIAETKEIGGRQVVVNDKGEGVTQIDGEWYPVDVNGCFYEGLLSDEVQTNPELYELRSRLSLKDVYLDNKKILEGTYLYSVGRVANKWEDHFGSTSGAYIWEKYEGIYPSYWEKKNDGIIWRQCFCYSTTTNQWLHMLDTVLPMPVHIEDETIFTRLAVGWFDENLAYNTFTHYQELGLDKIVNNRRQMMNKQLVYPASILMKPLRPRNAFDLWDRLIKEKKHVQIQIPYFFSLNKSHTLDSTFEHRLEQLMRDVPQSDPYSWSASAFDQTFKQWAQKSDNSLQFFTNIENRTEWNEMEEGKSGKDDNPWTRYIRKAVSGKFPILFIRAISIQK